MEVRETTNGTQREKRRMQGDEKTSNFQEECKAKKQRSKEAKKQRSKEAKKKRSKEAKTHYNEEIHKEDEPMGTRK